MARKGQAAVEFLMTYGWAILAAVIAIGVLSYFGVFSPGKFTTGTAIVTPPFYANAWNVKSSTGVTLELKNNGGEDYTISAINVTGTSPTINCGNTSSAVVSAGGTYAAILPCASALTAGNTYKGDIQIQYTKSGSSVVLSSTGTVAEKITA